MEKILILFLLSLLLLLLSSLLFIVITLIIIIIIIVVIIISASKMDPSMSQDFRSAVANDEYLGKSREKRNFFIRCVTCFLAYIGNEGPDQPAHPRGLIRAFAVRYQNHWILETT